MDVVQKSFLKSQEILTDPFALKRALPDTPEILTDLFRQHMLEREKLVSKSVIGQGQVWRRDLPSRHG